MNKTIKLILIIVVMLIAGIGVGNIVIAPTYDPLVTAKVAALQVISEDYPIVARQAVSNLREIVLYIVLAAAVCVAVVFLPASKQKK